MSADVLVEVMFSADILLKIILCENLELSFHREGACDNVRNHKPINEFIVFIA